MTPAQLTTLKTSMHSPANAAALGGFLAVAREQTPKQRRSLFFFKLRSGE